MINKIELLEDGLKILGLLTPEAREKIVLAFIMLDAENKQLHTEILQSQATIDELRNDIYHLQQRVDTIPTLLRQAGSDK